MTRPGTLQGRLFLVDLLADGTGVVRHRGNNRPVAITSAAAQRLEDAFAQIVDLLAEAAAAKPAVWTEGPCNRRD
jgi:hypothetical protein